MSLTLKNDRPSWLQKNEVKSPTMGNCLPELNHLEFGRSFSLFQGWEWLNIWNIVEAA